ncbi:MAG: 1-deoxy-D-xylulose 5-phosphate reductoisomerase [Candidatus Poribacteria bacterium]|nr:MAG: 1-deoxy-D-xylulose 5-phosphate reductoisomerase [Candidatus Poribacteria bacterium]
MSEPKRIAILGSTGSIGRSALDVCAAHPEHFTVWTLAAHRSVEAIVEQAHRFRPRMVAMADLEAAEEVRRRLSGETIEVHAGLEGLLAAATYPGTDLMLAAVVGAAGLLPTLEALRQGIDIAFVNKETLVLAGELVVRAAQESGARILPVDSEISAIFQCLEGMRRKEELKRVYLTASGGPFRNTPAEKFPSITPEQALKHPNWEMGPKVTVDSATLMNKGLEVIEARWLFGLELDQIAVVVHPQSIVHSYVEFIDGSVLAQLGVPDMRIPIQYALSYPYRLPTPAASLSLLEVGTLSFEPPDRERFPALDLCAYAAEVGGTLPAVLSAADEVAVAAFLEHRIRFDEIPRLIAATMERHEPIPVQNLETVLAADRWARETAQRLVEEGAIPRTIPPYLRKAKWP